MNAVDDLSRLPKCEPLIGLSGLPRPKEAVRGNPFQASLEVGPEAVVIHGRWRPHIVVGVEQIWKASIREDRSK